MHPAQLSNVYVNHFFVLHDKVTFSIRATKFAKIR